jgi:hypothetical protein
VGQHLTGMLYQHAQKIVLLGGQFHLFVGDLDDAQLCGCGWDALLSSVPTMTRAALPMRWRIFAPSPRRSGRRSVDRQVQTLDRCCAASDLGNSVDTVVVGWQTASLPAIAVSAGEAGCPRPRRASYPFWE